MMEFMHDDFPEPVAPEMRMCGISARFAMTARPAMSRPMATSSGWVAADGRASFDSRMSRSETSWRVRFGHLDADGRLAGDGRQDAHVGRRHGVGDVLGEAGDPGHLDPGPELELVAGDRGPDPAPDQPGLDPVRGERPHQVLAGGVDLALVLAQLLGRAAAADMLGSTHSPGRRADGGHERRPEPTLGPASGSGSSGMSMSASPSSRRARRARSPSSGTSGVGVGRGGRRRIVGDAVRGDHEGLALPQRGGGAPDGRRGRGEGPARPTPARRRSR